MEEYDEDEEELEEESGGYGWLWAVLGLAAAGGGAYYWFSLRPKQIIEAEKKVEEEVKVKVETDYQTKLSAALAAPADPKARPGTAKLAVDVEYPTVRYLDGRTERVSPEKKAELLASGKFRKGNATGTLLLEIDAANPTANTAPKHADAATGGKRGMSFGGKK